MAPGNRLDLDLTATADPGRELVLVDRFAGRSAALVRIQVQGAPQPVAAFDPPRGRGPLWAGAADEPVAAELRLNATRGGPFGISWTINGRAFTHDHDSPHHDIVAHLRRGSFSKLRFVNDSARLHPMHLHGVFFKLLSRDGVSVNEPHWRDTVLVHAKETVEIGTVPLDYGTWMLHCHILEHAEAGMMTLFDVGPG